LKKDREKSHFVGVRMTEDQAAALDKARQDGSMSKTDVLLRGLELVSEYYSIGADQRPAAMELNRLETEAEQHAASLKRIRGKEKAISEMVKELKAVDEIVDRHGCDKGQLIQILLDIQVKYNWLPKHALFWVSERLGIPLTTIYTVANFYEVLSLVPQGRHQCQVCMGTACHVRGAPQLLDRVSTVLNLKPGETDDKQQFTLKTVNCLGCCALGPVIKIDKNYISNPGTDEFRKLVADAETREK
jgi:NADH-quinone oxidoreductase subunit E